MMEISLSMYFYPSKGAILLRCEQWHCNWTCHHSKRI